jgi:hypothetical protein
VIEDAFAMLAGASCSLKKELTFSSRVGGNHQQFADAESAIRQQRNMQYR